MDPNVPITKAETHMEKHRVLVISVHPKERKKDIILSGHDPTKWNFPSSSSQ